MAPGIKAPHAQGTHTLNARMRKRGIDGTESDGIGRLCKANNLALLKYVEGNPHSHVLCECIDVCMIGLFRLGGVQIDYSAN